MKAFICFALIAVAANFVAATPVNSGSSSVSGTGTTGKVQQELDAETNTQVQAATDLTRLRKAAYGGGASSIPAPPCPKNYLFSCQPNLSPVPCAAPAAGGYGLQGAYSAPVPTYVTPVRANYGVPQTYNGGYVPQGLNYNANQYFQY